MIEALLKKRTHRMTQQRKVILEELKNMNSHPGADEIYERVRKRLPRISLGTVYRNLEILSEFNDKISSHLNLISSKVGAKLISLEKSSKSFNYSGEGKVKNKKYRVQFSKI